MPDAAANNDDGNEYGDIAAAAYEHHQQLSHNSGVGSDVLNGSHLVAVPPCCGCCFYL